MRLTTRPAAPVCLVTSVCPSICSAMARTSSFDLGEADAALVAGRLLLELALAAPAGMDLRLDDPNGTGELLRRLARLTRREGRLAVGRRHAELLQELFGLVFVNVHGSASSRLMLQENGRALRLSLFALPIWACLSLDVQAPSCGAILVQASTRPFTASTDLMNIERSAALRSISTIRSAPPAPMITGTPTYKPLTPYSPFR